MDIIGMTASPKRLSALLAVLVVLVSAGCGLAMNNEDRLNRAEQAFDNGEYQAAIIDVKNVLQEEPDNGRARLLLARTSIRIGDAASAEKEFRRAIELGTPLDDVAVDLGRALVALGQFQPVIDEISVDSATSVDDQQNIYLLRGNAFLGLGQFDDARESFTEILKSDDGNVDAQLGIVFSYVRERNFGQARATLDTVLATNSESARLWIASGMLNSQLRNLDTAEIEFNRALDVAVGRSDTATEAQALFGLGDVLFTKDNIDQARDVVDRLNVISPGSIDTMILTARLAYVDQDWKSAQEVLLEVLSRSPENRVAQMLLGATHLKSGNLAQAEMYLEAVVAAAPRDPVARRLLADARLQLNRLEEAQEILRPIVSGADADIGSLSMAAKASTEAGEFDVAIAYINRALASDPENTVLQFQLAEALIGSGQAGDAQQLLQGMALDFSEENEFRRSYMLVVAEMRQGSAGAAVDLAKDLVARHPDEGSAHNLLGSVQMTAGDLRAARESFNAAAVIAPGSLVLARNLALVDEAEGDFQASKDRYLGILEADPGVSWAMYALARLAARAGDFENTRGWLEKSIEADENWIAPKVLLGRLYVEGKDFESAEEIAKESLSMSDTNPEAHNTLGLALLGQGEYRASAASFENAMRLDRENPSYRLNFARAMRMAGDSAGALGVFDENTDQILMHLPSAVMLASLKIDTGDLDGAMEIADGIRNRYTDSPVSHALDGEIYARKGNPKMAADAYDRALAVTPSKDYAIRAYQVRNEGGLTDREAPLREFAKQRPQEVDIRLVLAQSYYEGGKVDQAVNEFEQLVQMNPGNFVALNNLAWIYYETGDQRAVVTARRAHELNPDDPSVLDTLGWVLVETGSAADGVEYLQSAVDRSDGRPGIKYHLAAGLAKAGREDEARRILETILAAGDEFASRAAAEKLLSTL